MPHIEPPNITANEIHRSPLKMITQKVIILLI